MHCQYILQNLGVFYHEVCQEVCILPWLAVIAVHFTIDIFISHRHPLLILLLYKLVIDARYVCYTKKKTLVDPTYSA